ncbi:hypothetical protein H7F15_06135 [Pontibacter sp. Tf4]|uniref:hypothetical protein n=1 Tax=Pontibacter sp. Tf4 TaxID=2761620 RepID=UPI0016287D0D|nr:hypothetical protein [Pontibacter sp. Tf4]MBB6610607.1 hypothetical protein [Pontibacter sp. Tf4]
MPDTSQTIASLKTQKGNYSLCTFIVYQPSTINTHHKPLTTDHYHPPGPQPPITIVAYNQNRMAAFLYFLLFSQAI